MHKGIKGKEKSEKGEMGLMNNENSCLIPRQTLCFSTIRLTSITNVL